MEVTFSLTNTICVFLVDFCSCLYDLFQHSVRGNLEAEDVAALLGRLVSSQVLLMCCLNLVWYLQVLVCEMSHTFVLDVVKITI